LTFPARPISPTIRIDDNRFNDYIDGHRPTATERSHMPSQTATGIKRPAPFVSLEHEVYLALQRLSSGLNDQIAELLKASNLSGPQFNVLRILRGAHEGLTCTEISERLIAKDPDVTRLLDRLEKQDLVARTRERQDRRIVTTRITEKGQAVLQELDRPIAVMHQRQLEHLGPEKLEQLLSLLEEATNGA
jgi:DNA-binding MarR family transcriptional regulator